MTLYTTDKDGNKTSQNFVGTEGNVIGTTRYSKDGFKYYTYNKDIQGSTTSVVGQDGTSSVAYDYDDFGVTRSIGDSTFFNEICYTGAIYDVSTGLYYLNARYYDPKNGRFITRDTYRGEINEPSSLHLYAYCANNPINYVDPSGHYRYSSIRFYKRYISVYLSRGVVIVVAGLSALGAAALICSLFGLAASGAATKIITNAAMLYSGARVSYGLLIRINKIKVKRWYRIGNSPKWKYNYVTHLRLGRVTKVY